ncbi:MAG: MBL fold metallo-hydrolase [Mariprofundaceae bacterium]
MKVKFWGVRGSIPSPGPATARYGGNTTCIEVRSDAGELIILDAGTGIFPLSHSLFPEFPLTAHIFNTHTHWDHIQGLPFFIPFFVPGNNVIIHGAMDPVSQKGISEILSAQLQYRFFPIREAELNAEIEYVSLFEKQSVEFGDVKVTPVMMNHPVINFGYRIDCNGKSVFFTGDHEPPYNIYEPDDEEYGEYQELIDQKNESILNMIQGVDILISDASYTPEEYPAKKGWGHGTYDTGIAMAKDIGAKKLYCTHHEPTRSDDMLEQVFAEALVRNPRKEGDPEYFLAQEGLEIEI